MFVHKTIPIMYMMLINNITQYVICYRFLKTRIFNQESMKGT